ncbi:hypothetical protein HPB50_005688 [Hyalomma asiaticum]|uniref:Uncharacterized protein n=1 Tax=Hyalomma asiaticum TaxID=266040 RepID=A0ACB7RY16_HYAAI|nr:hypothetical protein HPB50_005688 [Hyalomma asiaticum]
MSRHKSRLLARARSTGATNDAGSTETGSATRGPPDSRPFQNFLRAQTGRTNSARSKRKAVRGVPHRKSVPNLLVEAIRTHVDACRPVTTTTLHMLHVNPPRAITMPSSSGHRRPCDAAWPRGGRRRRPANVIAAPVGQEPAAGAPRHDDESTSRDRNMSHVPRTSSESPVVVVARKKMRALLGRAASRKRRHRMTNLYYCYYEWSAESQARGAIFAQSERVSKAVKNGHRDPRNFAFTQAHRCPDQTTVDQAHRSRIFDIQHRVKR